MVPHNEENKQKCVCPRCPSYPGGCKGELLYCAGVSSDCNIAVRGCNCPICLVYAENKLKELYFCGKEKVGDNEVYMRKIKEKEDPAFYQKVVDIKNIAEGGKSIVRSMGSRKIIPFGFGDLNFIPAQVAKFPLNKEEEVKTAVIIGPKSKKPLKITSPILISGLSFGAVSKKVRLVITAVSAELAIAYNSGEGGVLEEELAQKPKYLIGQYATGRFGITDDILKQFSAVEIRFGQGAYPGKGSYLPASKITEEIAKIRGLKKGEAAYSPARHPDIKTSKELKDKIAWLKKITKGVPVGAKIGCGNLEEDLKVLAGAGVDFIALDGFSGGTGATDYYVRENVGIPIIAALPRADNFLKKIGVRKNITLIACGGLRDSADFAKCLALGADAIYIGTAALIAMNCEQYRVCHTGMCPTGITTHNPGLVRQLDIGEGVRKLTNFIKVSTEEITNFARIVGKDDIKKLAIADLVAFKKNLAEITGARWLK